MNLMAEIMQSDREIKGYVGGVFKWDSFTSETAAFFSNEKLRLTLEEGFAKDDLQLNQRLRKLDAFVLDSRSYKCPSGLGIRAMAMGRPIIALDSPSWIATLIREEGVGIFWRPGEGNLTESLRAWSASGGSFRSMETARRLSDQRGLEAAYSTMFERLKKRMEQRQ
jgi:glycosyltransferase involved in cell wall biosynthesis